MKTLLILLLCMGTLGAQTTTQKLRDTLKAAEVQLENQKAEILAKDQIILAQKGYLLNSAVSLIQAQKDVIQVQKNADGIYGRFINIVNSYSVLQSDYIKIEEKYSKLSGKVNVVAFGVGSLFALCAFLALTKFLGSSAFLAGPYGVVAYISASAVAFGAGVSAVTLFFRG